MTTTKKRRRNETRNKIAVTILMIIWTVAIAGYLNYMMLVSLHQTHILAQIFSEIGLLSSLIFINTKIIKKIYPQATNDDTVLVAALVAVALAASVAAALIVMMVMMDTMLKAIDK